VGRDPLRPSHAACVGRRWYIDGMRKLTVRSVDGEDLKDTLAALRHVTEADVEQSIEPFAEAEGSVPEPIQARQVQQQVSGGVDRETIRAILHEGREDRTP
jgi:hypothetical protein